MMASDSKQQERNCPACGAADYSLFANENIDHKRVNDFTYSSRKKPEYMCLRLVRCNSCNLIYAPVIPNLDFLHEAYSCASFDSNEEAICAAKSYSKVLNHHLSRLSQRTAAVDVGSGSGPLLPLLVDAGFKKVVGIEPSRAAIDAAPDDVKPMLREGMFSAELLSDISPSLICSFMTLEHINEPDTFSRSAYDLLAPGGMIAVVVHNWTGMLNRILGLRSPIIDVEHLQLFDPSSVSILLRRAGFRDVHIESISNTYPLKYWVRLTPIPETIRSFIIKAFELMHIDRIKISVRVGNILAIATKPVLEES